MESKETHTHTHVQIKGVRRSEAVVFETLKKRSHCNTARSKRVYCILYIIYIVFLEAEDIGPIPPHDLWEHHLPRALRNNPLIHLSTHPQVASEGTEPTSQKPGKQTTTLFHFVGEIIYLQKYTYIYIKNPNPAEYPEQKALYTAQACWHLHLKNPSHKTTLLC